MSKESWRKARKEDPSIVKVIACLDVLQRPSSKTLRTENPEVKLLLREWNKFEFKDGTVNRRCFDRGDEIFQLILPMQYRDKALHGLHDEVGHLGHERVLVKSCAGQG